VTSPDVVVVPAPAGPLTLRWLLAYTAALAAAELLLTVSVPVAAIAFALLVIALRFAVPATADPDASFLSVLVAVPVVRLITVAAPGAEIPSAVRLGALAVPIFLTVLLAARNRPPDWRLVRPGPGGWRIQALVALAGVPLAIPVYLLAGPAVADPGGLPRLIVVALLVVAVIPDELLFRGLLVPAFAVVAPRAAVPVAAAVYAATFLGYASLGFASVPVVATAYGIGLALSWLRWRTGSSIGVIVARVVLVGLVCLAASVLNG
jgi:hypothetical protein